MRKLLFLLTICCVQLPLMAQDVMEQINQVKLEGGHLTAQYSHESVDTVFLMGKKDILHQLNMKGLGLFKLDEIDSKVKHLDMHRGNQYRVFSYLKLSDISRKANSHQQEEKLVIVPKFDVKEESSTTTHVANNAHKTNEVRNVQQPTEDLPTQIARDIMNKRDHLAALNALNAKKNMGQVIDCGPFSKSTNIDEVYIAIFDRNSAAPLAVLSPTINGKRTNLITKSEDSLSNYHGCRAIWFKF